MIYKEYSLTRRCPICNGSDANNLHHQKFILFDGYPLAAGYDIVCCNICGFVYADSPAMQKEYDDFYTRFSIYEERKTLIKTEETWWDRQRFQQTATYLTKILSSRNMHILDIGCANGGLLNELFHLGFSSIEGIDPSIACVANTRGLGIKASQSSLNDFPVIPEKYDCIILSHVLEHVYDLLPSLQKIYDILDRGGFLYIEVPDASRYADFVIAPFQDFNTEHINHFSRQSLINLISQFRCREIDHGSKEILSSPGMPYPVIYSTWEKVDDGEKLTGINKDRFLQDKINRYIEISQSILKRIDDKLRNLFLSETEIIVWGTGQLCMKLLAETSLGSANIVAFVDGNPINHGKTIRGVRILSPQEVREMKIPILITTTLHQDEIMEVIRNVMKMDNKVFSLPING